MFGFSNEGKKGNYVFIDSQNLMQSIKEQGWKMDHKKFVAFLQENYNAEKIFYFVGYNKDHQYLYNILKDAGYTLVYKPAIRMPDGSVKANVDTDLVLYTMIEINNYDRALIVTGDGDFATMIKYLDKNGKLEKVIVPDSHKFSGLLKEASNNKLAYMDMLKKEVGIKSTGSGPNLFKMFGKLFGK